MRARILAIASLAAMFLCARVATAQPPPTGVPETEAWEAWQAARPKIPAPVEFLDPMNGATDVSVNPTIRVKSIGATTIEWRFGTTNKPPLVAGQTGFSFTPPMNLMYGTTYWVQARGKNMVGNTALTTASWKTAAAPPGPPVLTCPSAVSVQAPTTGPVPVSFLNPTVMGGQTPITGPTCDPVSGSLFPVGMTTVTCAAKDALNRSATCTVPVTVTYMPSQQVESPAGTHVPRDATSLVDAMRNVWSFGTQMPAGTCGSGTTNPSWCKQILNNGIVMAMYYGFEYQMGKDRHVYVRGDDAYWYKVSDPGYYGCMQGQPCAAPVDYYGDKPPDDTSVTLPACRDGIDNDGDGKIDFGTGPNNDPGCSSAEDLDETDMPVGRKVAATHDGKAPSFVWTDGKTYTTLLKYRVLLDGVKVSEWNRDQVWVAGTVTVPFPTMTVGTHLIQLTAVGICQANDPCGYPERESVQSLPPLEVQGP